MGKKLLSILFLIFAFFLNTSLGFGQGCANKPTASISVSGATTICAGSSATITFTATPNTIVTYRINSGGDLTINIPSTGSSTVTASNLTSTTTYSLISVKLSDGSCSQTQTSSATITVNPLPIVEAGATQTVCAGGKINLAGSVTGSATTGTWSAPSGTFSNAGSLISIYTPSIASGTVTLTLTSADPTGPCPSVTDTVVISVNPATVVDAGTPQTVCAGGTINLAGIVSGGATTGTWSAPSGTFSSAGSLTSNYTPTIASGTVTLTFTSADSDGAGPCTTVTDTVEITVNPATVVDAGIPQTVCAGGTITLAGRVSGGATSGTWSAPSGTFSSAGSLTSNYTPTVASGTVTLTLTSADSDGAGPCTTVTDTVEITVNPATVVDAGTPQTVCAGGTIILAGSVLGGATSGTWSAPSGTFSNAGSLSSTYTPTIATGTVTLTLTSADSDGAGPCTTVTDTVEITVNPATVVDAGTPQTVCAGGTISLAGSISGGATSGTWSGPSGTFSSAGSLTSTYTPTIASGTVTLTLTSTDSDSAGPCTTVLDTVEITVNPSTVVDAGTPQIVCAGGTITLAGSVSGGATSGTWSAPSGTFSNAGSFSSTYTPTIASGTVTLTLTSADSDGAGPCTTITDTVEITVNPATVVDAGATQTVCAGGIITLVGSVSGGATSGTWSAPSGTFSSAGSLTSTYTPTIASGPVTLTLTSADSDGAGPCTTVTDTVVITVIEEVIITSQPLPQDFCSANKAEFKVEATGAELSYQWFKTSDATTEGTAISGATSKILSINRTVAGDAGFFYVRITGASVCEPVKSDVVALDVDENVVIQNQPINQDLCLNDNLTLTIAATADGGDPVFQWRKNGVELKDDARISGSTTRTLNITGLTGGDAGEYDVIIDGPDDFMCDVGFSEIATVTVFDPPTANAGINFSVCSTTTEISFGTGAAAENYTSLKWTIISGSGRLQNDTALNAKYIPAANETGNITLQLQANGNGSCTAATDEVVITIIPLPVIETFSYPANLCVSIEEAQSPTVTGQNGYSGGTFSYVFTGDGNGTLNLDTTTGTIIPFGSTVGSYSITYTAPADGYCETATKTVDISIGPLPIAEFSYENTPFCSNSTNPTPTLAANGTAGIFSSGAGLVFVSTSTGEINLAASEPGTYTITNTIGAANGCKEVTATAQIVITKLPVAEFSYTGSPYCSDGENPVITLATGTQTGTFTSSSPNLVFVDISTGEIDITTSKPGDYTVTNTIIPANGCAAVTSTANITISKLPVATFKYDGSQYCSDTANPIPIIEGEAVKGIFSSTAGLIFTDTSTGEIDIANSTPGIYTVTNTVDFEGEGEDGCSFVTATFDVTISKKPIADFSYPVAEYCSDPSAPVVIEPTLEANAVKGIFSYTATPEGATLILDPTTGGIDITTSDAGTFVLTNTVDTAEDGCDAVNDTSTITINKKSNATFSYTSSSYCITSGNAVVAEGYETGGTFSSSTLGSSINSATGNITWNSGESVAGSHQVTYRIEGKGACAFVEHTTTIKIDPVPLGGKLVFQPIVTADNDGRIFVICEENDPGYAQPLSLLGSQGQVVAWRYRGANDTSWSIVNNGEGGNFTGTTLSATQVETILNGNLHNGDLQTTVFRVEVSSGACSPNQFSETGIVSVIPSNIEPTPVEIDPTVICFGENVNLYAETGYETGGAVTGGEFDSANSLTSVHGWRVRRDGSTNNLDFPASGNNTKPNIWSNTNDQPFFTANVNGSGGSNERWDSGDKKFAIVTGNNKTTLETSVFAVDGIDQAIVTFDQAYNLTSGASIRVEISTNGGASYEPDALYEVTGPSASGNIGNFGSSTSANNKIRIDLGNYIGNNNVRIRFHFLGARDGDVWALDAIDIPNGPRGVELEWNDYTDPANPVFIGNATTEIWTPTQIGLNTFVVKTMLTTNSNGDLCDVIQHEESVEVFVYDKYTSIPTAAAINCGTNSVNLSATVTGGKQGLINNFPTPDGFVGRWEVVASPAGYLFDAEQWSGGISNPTAVFTPNIVGTYTVKWVLELEDETAVSECENDINEITFSIFDQYTSTPTAAENNCGDNSVELTALISGVLQNNITTFPTPDGTSGEWQVITSPNGYTYSATHFSALNNPTSVFTPNMVGNYTLRFALINENNLGCINTITDIDITIFDLYTSKATAVLDTCTTNSYNLQATTLGAIGGTITFPTADGTTGVWEVIESPEGYVFADTHFTGGASNPAAVFTPEVLGKYTLNWTLVNENLTDECIIPYPVSFKLFDHYTLTAEADAGSCGNFVVQLKGATTGIWQETITYPTQDGYIGQWSVAGGTGTLSNPDPEDNVEPINNPNAIFTANALGTYTFTWELIPDPAYLGEFVENTSCPAGPAVISVEIKECIALDFDGMNDYVDLGEGYTGNYSLEAWILPKEAGGTIISGPNFIVTTPAGVSTSKWTHVAVSNGNLYLDGVVQPNVTITGSGGAKALIGARWSEDGATDFFHGWIEEVRIWNGTISQENIRFTMNQRLKPTGNIGVEVDMDHPDSPGYSNLAGYYQLLATEADILPGGLTLDLATNSVNGKLMNMETLQENTAPLPYFTKQDGPWDTAEIWARPTVWKIPNTNGVNWNIVRTLHNVNATRDISVLGLISEANTLDMVGTIPADGSHLEVGTGNALTISHYLKLNGIIDLNGESQLLQPELSILVPESAGHLDRDQQGKRNSFIYNYWASPVSTTGSANNGGYTIGGILLDGTTPATPKIINFQEYHGAADGNRTSPITLSTYWLWAFTPATANVYAEWDHIRATGNVRSGEGFTMKGTDGNAGLNGGQNYTFRGKPHNGNINLNMKAGENYLIGNPYPSAFDGHEFIRNNIDRKVFDGSLYFWDHFSIQNHILKEYIGGYGVLNLTSSIGVPAVSIDERINPTADSSSRKPTRYIAVSQGFMVNSTGVNGGEVRFKNSQRIFVPDGKQDTSIFLRPEEVTKKSKSKSNEYIKIRFSFSSPIGLRRQILVGAVPQTTNGFDLGYDALLFDDNVEDMYFVQDANYLVIQGVPHFNADQILPLGVKIKENKPFTIRIDSLENAPAGMKVYLNDKLNDSIHDLTSSSYNSTSEPGVINDRFEIIFYKEEPPVIEVPGEEIPVEEIVNLTITHAHDLRQIKIINPEEMAISGVYLFDLKGNLIDSYGNLPNEKEFKLNVASYATGVYLVKVYAEGKIVTKKIIISN